MGVITVTSCLLNIVNIDLVLIPRVEVAVPLHVLALVEKHRRGRNLTDLKHLLRVRFEPSPLP